MVLAKSNVSCLIFWSKNNSNGHVCRQWWTLNTSDELQPKIKWHLFHFCCWWNFSVLNFSLIAIQFFFVLFRSAGRTVQLVQMDLVHSALISNLNAEIKNSSFAFTKRIHLTGRGVRAWMLSIQQNIKGLLNIHFLFFFLIFISWIAS